MKASAFEVRLGASCGTPCVDRAVKASEDSRELLARLQIRDCIQKGFQRSCSQLVSGGLVHAGREQVANLLLIRRPVRGWLPHLFEDPPEKPEVFIGQLAVNAPGGLVGWNGIFLHPAPA